MRVRDLIQYFAIFFILISIPEYGTRVSAKPDSSVLDPAQELSRSFSALVKQVRPSVVSVFTTRVFKFRLKDMPDPFRQQFLRDYFGARIPPSRTFDLLHEYRVPQTGAGSGMILDTDGNILTNHHLVNQFDEIQVLFQDRKKRKAKLIGRDPKTDLAVIRVQDPEGLQLNPVALGNSDEVLVGDLVLAIGTPFGLPNSVSHGIVSAIGIPEIGWVDEGNFIQTDAPINPGNSGGPLLNMKGEVIGVNSAIASLYGSSMGVGFSIPSNKLKSLIPRMIKGETIERGELGIWVQGDGAQGGVLVTMVNPDSAAEKSGIKIGDLIVKINGESVLDLDQVRTKMAKSKPGEELNLEVNRSNRKIEIKVILGAS